MAMIEKETKKLKLISLFAGIGGFELGFKDFAEIVWSNEIDKYACQTFRANFPNVNLVEGDIRNIKAYEIPSHDILVGGFPCQSFSVAQSIKENKGLNDPRGHLFKEILRVAEYHKPSWLLLENVKGIIFKNNKEAYDLIIKGIEDLGYKVKVKVLNAKDYGVPQNRERVYFVGNRFDIDFKWPRPVGKPTRISDILLNEVNDKYYLSDEAWEGMKSRKEKGRGHGFSYRICEPTDPTTQTPLSRYYKSGNEILLFQYRRNYIRESKENISPTLTSNMGSGGNNVPFVKTGLGQNTPRKLTPRECARLQGFSDDFKIVVSDTQAYKQFGNAVCVPVIKKLANRIYTLNYFHHKELKKN